MRESVAQVFSQEQFGEVEARKDFESLIRVVGSPGTLGRRGVVEALFSE